MLDVLLVLLAASIAVFIGAELVCRWWLRNRSHQHPFIPGARLHMKVDKQTLPRLEADVHLDISAEGVRTGGGASPPRGAGRVLVAGGSSAEGFMLDWSSSWAGALEEFLNEPESLERFGHRSIHVGNTGRSRMGAEGMRMILEELLPRYSPLEALIIMVGATDVLDWFHDGAQADWTPPVVPETHVFSLSRHGVYGWSPRHLALVEILRRMRNRLLRPVTVKENAGETLAKVRAMRANAEEIIQEHADPSVMLERFRSHFRKALVFARGHAKRILVVRQPGCWRTSYTAEEAAQLWNCAVGNPYKQPCTRYFSFDVTGEMMEQVNDAAETIAEQMDIPVLDLMPHLERSPQMYYDFFHYTPVGGQAVGELVAKALQGEELPAPRHPRRAPEEPSVL